MGVYLVSVHLRNDVPLSPAFLAGVYPIKHASHRRTSYRRASLRYLAGVRLMGVCLGAFQIWVLGYIPPY